MENQEIGCPDMIRDHHSERYLYGNAVYQDVLGGNCEAGA